MKAEHTVADLESVKGEIAEVVQLLQDVIDTMQQEQMPAIQVHAKDIAHKHIPALWKWATKLNSEFQVQLRIFQTARRDRKAFDKPAGRKAGGRKGK